MTTSVIIATHNRHEELAELLGDLAQQDSMLTEVIVVDSEQGEDSRPVVAAAAARGLPVKHVISPNVLATKRNYGAKTSVGDLLIILDDDLRVGPSFVSRHAAAHDDEERLASGMISFPDEWVRFSNYYRFKQGRHAANDESPNAVPPHRFVAMNHSIRRSSYMTLGGYDDDYLMYGGEDLDFGHRAKRSGLRLVVATGADAIHHEVRMTWRTYLSKVHKAAYYGLPLVLERNPESASVSTMQAIGAGRTESVKMHALRALVWVLARRPVLRAIATTFEKTDNTQFLYAPYAYLATTLATNRLGYDDQKKDRPYVPLF